MANRKIVRVKRSSKYSDRIIIHLDDKSVFRVPEDVFVSNPLHVGDTVSLEKIESYGKKMRLQEARDSAFRLLGYRMRSIAEMKKRLNEKDFDEEEVDKTIQYLMERKYLNDEEFGKAFVKEKVKNKKIGPRALKSEMYPHHLSPDLVDTLINNIYREFDLSGLIEFHLSKRRIEKNIPLNHKEKNKLTNFLTRKGFFWETIQTVYHDWGLL
ncbi:MAG: RecX family transcriptional regulator [Candidatus Marinimicrobia bacterium]|nr:RecX family transcriptional regulator [Candidatus Neomarinimicrobiota bacterium]MBL7011032.1 RecX family transcriptional regulator [Candidatus Neomarinimicrobiota bacterium]MBL7029964.1 RecX family transcriptional regulator [Candidatus Neomarinimicrobiota bacterium]